MKRPGAASKLDTVKKLGEILSRRQEGQSEVEVVLGKETVSHVRQKRRCLVIVVAMDWPHLCPVADVSMTWLIWALLTFSWEHPVLGASGASVTKYVKNFLDLK